MREIKFRAWSAMHKVMHYDSDCLFETGGLSGYLTIRDKQTRELIIGNCTTTMQYTGLKDKRGREIYEGDIIQTELDLLCDYLPDAPYRGVVTYIEDGYHIVQPRDSYTPTLRNLAIQSIEILGNIYEHPELLRQVIIPGMPTTFL